jgi:hypothetical protein
MSTPPHSTIAIEFLDKEVYPALPLFFISVAVVEWGGGKVWQLQFLLDSLEIAGQALI